VRTVDDRLAGTFAIPGVIFRRNQANPFSP